MRFIALLVVALCLITTTPASAQSKKELAAQNAQLAERLLRLEQRMLTGDPAAERLMTRMDALETSQRRLTGEIERLTYERDQLKAEVEALEGDVRAMQELSDRIKIHMDAVDLVAKEQTAPRTYSGPTSPISSIPGAPIYKEKPLVIGEPVPDEMAGPGPSPDVMNDVSQLGQIGKSKLAEGDYVGAQISLKQYLQFNPDAPDAGEMSYWLGESYFVRGGYADAADAYISSMRKAPQGIKAPDAMIRLAATLNALGQKAEACQTLASFPAQYPNASAQAKQKAATETARAGC